MTSFDSALSKKPNLVPWVLFALVVIWLALFFRLGSLPLIQPDEGRSAEVAREMKESGAWLSPSYNGITYLNKPAFYFKAVALSLAAFGNNETAARLPSALFALSLLVIIFFFCRRAYGTLCAIMAVIVVATMPLFIANSRTSFLISRWHYLYQEPFLPVFWPRRAMANPAAIGICWELWPPDLLPW